MRKEHSCHSIFRHRSKKFLIPRDQLIGLQSICFVSFGPLIAIPMPLVSVSSLERLSLIWWIPNMKLEVKRQYEFR